jgi:O-succinylbenzoate synthase
MTTALRIREAAAYRISIPLVEPFRISSGAISDKEAVLVWLSDGNSFGWGESSAMSGSFYSTETPEQCWHELVDTLIPSVLGREFASIEALNIYLEAATPNRFARVAVETAAWELLARGQNKAVDQLLGFPARPIPSGLAVGLYGSPEELLAAIERQQPRRYRRLKIKIKRRQDVQLVRAVRERYGDIPLYVDANADYTREDFHVFEELDQFDLMMFEQPLAKDDLEGAAMLQRRVRTPVCLDESIETAELAEQAIRMGSCRIVNMKLQRVGGLTEALRIVEVCRSAGVPLWMGTMPELGVGSAQALALAASPAFVLPTDVEPSRRWYVDDILTPELGISQDGFICPPPGSGWRYEVDQSKVAQYCKANKTW